jgi:hypothetical protein
MPFTDDDGRFNNFAKEPKMYAGETNPNQNRNYLIAGGLGILLVIGLIVVASQVS